MFYLNKQEELTTELLQKMINKFITTEEPRLRKNKNYYDGVQDIINKRYSDVSKPCNRIVTNFAKNIADSYCGYIATPGHITYRSDNDITEIMNVLKYNDYQAHDAAFLLDGLVYGKACELMYIDSQSQTRFKLINPNQCFGVYDDSLAGDLMYFVRIYKANEWNDSDLYYADVYSDYSVKHYSMNGRNGYLNFIGEEAHFFSQCPANIFYLPDEKSIFECVLDLQNAYNTLLSAEVDDYQAFCDAYLVLKGVDADAEDIATMKANRVMLVPEGAEASYLTKAPNDAQIENMLKRIHDSIYRIASCVDFSSETLMNGVSSGVAIRYKMCGQENRAGTIEAAMKKALQRRVEIISGIATLKLGEEVFRDIEIDFKRNIPEDITSTINIINSLKGTVSDATLLTQLPFIDDVNEEMERVQEQKAANMALYSFGSASTDEDDEGAEE